MSPEPTAPRPSRSRAGSARSAGTASACTSEPVESALCEDRRQRRSPCRCTSRITARERAGDAAEQPLDHERAAHEPVRRADELHHLDLTPPREDREPDRVRDQERRGRRAARAPRSGRSPRSHCATLEDPVRGLAAVLDLVDARRPRVQAVRDRRRSCSPFFGVTLERVRERVDGRFCGQRPGSCFCICLSACALRDERRPFFDAAGSARDELARRRSPACRASHRRSLK